VVAPATAVQLLVASHRSNRNMYAVGKLSQVRKTAECSIAALPRSSGLVPGRHRRLDSPLGQAAEQLRLGALTRHSTMKIALSTRLTCTAANTARISPSRV
jgi:hypothetical protein